MAFAEQVVEIGAVARPPQDTVDGVDDRPLRKVGVA
jgi:hypothetical protein